MSHQRKRHLQRQPIEESVRIAVSDLVGTAGDVEVERHSYDWRPDDLLVWVRVHLPITGSVYSHFRWQVAESMRSLLPAGQPFGDWLVVIQCEGNDLGTVAWDDKLLEFGREEGEI